MAAWDHGYVSDIAYTTGFYRETMPTWLSFAAAILAHRPPDLARPYRYADLGCGNGIGVLVAAATAPHAEFWGFDFSPTHIEFARNLGRDRLGTDGGAAAVKAHPFFRRVGDDVTCMVPITFTQAALGAEVEVPTLDGKAKMRVPAGTQPGTVLRLKGKGIPRRVGVGRGDQMTEVTVEVPTRLSQRQRELIEQLANELSESVQPEQRSFMEKLRALFG